MKTKNKTPAYFIKAILSMVFTLGAVSLARADAYSDAVLSQSPSFYYRFQSGFEESGTVVVNSGGQGAAGNGTASSSSVLGTASGPSGIGYPGFQSGNYAGTFSGGSNVIFSQNPAFTSSLNGSAAVTVEMWLNADSVSNWATLFQMSNNTSGNTLKIDIGPSGRIQIGSRRDVTGTFVNTTVFPALTADTWYHIAIVIDYANASLSFYKNGTIVGTSQSVAWGGTSTAFSVASSSSPVIIGSAYSGVAPFAGDLDEFAIYNQGLTAEQIQNHYLAGISSIPEPATASMLLGLAALGGCIGARRFSGRRRSA